MGCLNLLLDFARRRVKRLLNDQNYLDKFYPHSVLTIAMQMIVAYGEAEKYARIWCDAEPNIANEVNAVKEIFETENKEDAVWMTELMANKYVAENVDRLIYTYSVRAMH